VIAIFAIIAVCEREEEKQQRKMFTTTTTNFSHQITYFFAIFFSALSAVAFLFHCWSGSLSLLFSIQNHSSILSLFVFLYFFTLYRITPLFNHFNVLSSMTHPSLLTLQLLGAKKHAAASFSAKILAAKQRAIILPRNACGRKSLTKPRYKNIVLTKLVTISMPGG
jgi:hypothetical protein